MTENEKKLHPINPTAVEVVVVDMPRAVAADTDRVTGRLDIYYEQMGEEPMHVHNSFSAVGPHNPDGPYTRKLSIGSDGWVGLDLGWVGTAAGYIVITNRRKPRTTKPTADEAAADAACALLVCHEDQSTPPGPAGDGDAAWRVGVGRFFVAEAVDATKILVRAEHGTARINITVFPR